MTNNNAILNSSDPTSWRLIPEYVYVGGKPSLINGSSAIVSADIAMNDIAVSSVPFDLRQRHLWIDGVCDATAGPFVNIEDFGATPDDQTDDRVAIQKAIDFSATQGHGRVFVPVGRYILNGSIDLATNLITPPTLTLAANTQLFGAHQSYSILDGSEWAYPADNQDLNLATRVPLIQTVDDASATTAMCDLRLEVGVSDNLVYGVQWKAGQNSLYKDNHVDLYVKPTGTPVGTTWRHRIEITGNGGGKWYNHHSTRGYWDGNIEGSRLLYVTGTTQPLNFYMLQNQYLKPRFGYMSEFLDVSNLRIYGIKSEGVLCKPNQQGNCTYPWYGKEKNYASPFHIKNGNNIGIYSYEGTTDMSPGRGVFELDETMNIKIVHVGRRYVKWGSAWPKNQWYFIREKYLNNMSGIDATQDFSSYYLRNN